MNNLVEVASRKTVSRAATSVPVPAPASVRTAATSPLPLQLQSTLRVSNPRDPAEREADTTAKKIMRMSVAESPGLGVFKPGGLAPSISRFSDSITRMRERSSESILARRADGPSTVAPDVSPSIHGAGAGSPLPPSVRRFMEPRFGADFSRVRVHTGEQAARLNRAVSAQAFTVGNQIFFGRDRFQPDSQEGRELIAHELTHTIQQGAANQHPIQRSADVTITQGVAPHLQRLGIGDALSYFADRATAIPGFRMFTTVLGVNPINMARVDRSAANILRALVEFLPGGALITQALDNHGIFDRVGGWVEQQVLSLGLSGAALRDAINKFLDSLSLRDALDLGGVWDRAKRIFSEPIAQLISLAKSLFGAILRFIKDAILRPIADLAAKTRGWDLLCAVLGSNPITGDAVPRNAETLIGGFMKLIGQEETWENIKRGNAVARAWAWFQCALAGLLGYVRQIPKLFLQALSALEIGDLVLLPRAFAKVASVFGNFIGSFLTWAGTTVWDLLEIVFSVVAPSVLGYLRRAAGAFRTILRDPIGFVRNLVRAGSQGFRQFADNFVTHLRASLLSWITGALSGANIYIPQGFTLREIIKFVLSVLGLTWQNIRQKLVRAVGETAVRAMETGFDIVKTLVTQGPSAAWEKIQESLGNLRELVMEQIMTFLKDRVVTAAVTRLLSMLSPAGAFIQAIIAIYNTVMFFVERLRQISQVAASFIDSISAIANGVVGAAANRVEQTMAGLLTLVISFLARIAGLGKVSEAVTNVVNRVRQPVDKALDRVVEWIIGQSKAGGSFTETISSSLSVSRWWRKAARFLVGSESHTVSLSGDDDSAELMVASTPQRLTTLVAAARLDHTSPADIRSIEEIEGKIACIAEARTQLRKLRKSNASESNIQKQHAVIDISLDAIAAHIGILLKGDDIGTPQRPIKLTWPKPAWSEYPHLFLYHAMKDPSGWQLTSKQRPGEPFVKRYVPSGEHKRGDHAQGPIPSELDQLGILGNYRIAIGSVVGPLGEETTSGGKLLNNLLARFGWSPSSEKMDADHVLEIQMGGSDVLSNLWPLAQSTNRSAGKRLSQTSVEIGAKTITIDILKRVRQGFGNLQKNRKFYFEINKTT